MKISKYFIPALLSPLMLVGCADYDDWNTNPGEKPASIAGYEYLNDYAPLKENLNRTANPNFKLGAGIGESEFNQKASLFRLASHNFDEIVAGNAMKMASCVNAESGEMDFSGVSTFLQSAEEAGLDVKIVQPPEDGAEMMVPPEAQRRQVVEAVAEAHHDFMGTRARLHRERL